MNEMVIYNGAKYRKHPKQKYYYTHQKKGIYSRSLHRQIWFDNMGEIPKGCQVHHIDGDASNNCITNLELVERIKHLKHHAIERVKQNPQRFKDLAEIGRKFASLWHKSDEGREYHRREAIKKNFGKFDYGIKQCEECGVDYNKKTKRSRFCSNNCKSASRRKNNPDKKIVNCKTCGIEYQTLKYLPRKYCSKKCRPTPNPLGHHARKGFIQKVK